MTVDDLLKALAKMRAEAEAVGDTDFGRRLVVLASEAEGGTIKKLAEDGVEHAGFDEDEETVCLLALDDELRKAGFTDDDMIKDALAAVVMYPEK